MQKQSNIYLITGANGQLGRELARLLPDAILTDVAELDICDEAAVMSFVTNNKISHIINCAAFTAVDLAEEQPQLAAKINVDGPRALARSGAAIIHVSTDYVFDGRNYRPYREDDSPCPQSVYGQTKLDGENAVLAEASTALIIRTAWLYSAHGKNFVKTMRQLCASRESLNVVADQIGSPTFAGDLASAIVQIIPQLTAGTKGIYHYSNEGACSWYDFAVEIAALSGITSCQISPIRSDQYPTPAERPFYSLLDKSKIKNDFNITIPHWKESLITCLKQYS